MKNTRLTDEWGSFSAIPNEFIDHARSLSDQARWLFVLLRRHTNQQTGIAFPSYAYIQDQTGWTPKTIARAVRELEASGWLVRRKNFSAPTEYALVRKPPSSAQKGASQGGVRHFPEGSNDTSHREVTHFPQGSNALPTGKSNKKEERKKKDMVTSSPGTTPAEIYAEIADRQLSIREQELIESKVPDSEAEAFRDFVTGWAATYGTKAVFKVLEAYGKHKQQQGAGFGAVDLGKLKAALDCFRDPVRAVQPAVEAGERAGQSRDLDDDSRGTPGQDDFFSRQAARNRAQLKASAGSGTTDHH